MSPPDVLEQLVALQKVGDGRSGVTIVLHYLSVGAGFDLANGHDLFARARLANLRGLNAQVAQGQLRKGLFPGAHDALHGWINSLEGATGDGNNGWQRAFDGAIS